MAADTGITGRACDLCAAESAIATLMNLDDYTTVAFGVNCLPEYLLSIVQAVTGVAITAPGEGAQAAAAAEPAELPPPDAIDVAGQDDDDSEPGSAADHWASTRNVVRSTHGHRGSRKDEPDVRPDAH